jgi:hypothetical protein
MAFFRKTGRVAVLLAVLFSTSCSESMSPTEIKPGETGYPTENTHPTQFLQVTAKLPQTLSVRFRVGYSASPLAASCQRTVGLGVSAPYSVSLPLQLDRVGDSYQGRLAIDRFMPGSCGWRFVGVWYSAEVREVHDHELIMYGTQVSRSLQIDVWCMDFPKATERPAKVCEGLDVLSRDFQDVIPPGLLKTIPNDQRAHGPPARIGSDSSVVEITFHDLDMIRRNFKLNKPQNNLGVNGNRGSGA